MDRNADGVSPVPPGCDPASWVVGGPASTRAGVVARDREKADATPPVVSIAADWITFQIAIMTKNKIRM